jgi:hypothetical protein
MNWQSFTWIFVALGILFIPLGAVLLFKYTKGPGNITGEILKDAGVALATTGLITQAFFSATKKIEDDRSKQAHAIEEGRAERAERSENRRFVIDASGSMDASVSERPRLFNGFDLRGQHLNGVQLPGVRFNDADLTESSLYQANLDGVDFIDARLICASLHDADLTDDGENDLGPDLRRAELQGADLRDVKFGNADLEDAVFGVPSGYSKKAFATDIRGADLSEVDNIELARFDAVIWDAWDPNNPTDPFTQWPTVAGFERPESAPIPNKLSWPLCTPARYTLESPPER